MRGEKAYGKGSAPYTLRLVSQKASGMKWRSSRLLHETRLGPPGVQGIARDLTERTAAEAETAGKRKRNGRGVYRAARRAESRPTANNIL